MSTLHCSSSMVSIPVLCPKTHPNPKLQPLTFQPLLRSSTLKVFRRVSKDGGCLSNITCSTSMFKGRVGFLHHGHGNFSFLSFGVDESVVSEVGNERDWSQILSALLPFVVAATAVSALVQPSTFTWVSKELYAPALGGIMLSIGIKLSMDDFALAFKRPLPLSIGFIVQYVLKPALGVLIAKAFGMPRMFYGGFILMACVSGAQLSSYASFLGKGDVALSILLTSSTTIASVIVTPLLTGLMIGSVVPVDAVAMSKSILQVVLVPVTLGLLLNTYAKPVVSVLQPVMPFVAMICTSICIGYWFSSIPSLRQEEHVSRTISLCSGMQSSTLAGLLATQFLGSTQAVPPACSVVAMAIMGLCLASFWGSGFQIRNLLSLPTLRTNSTVKA
ncbi:putative Bile acid:sodium symporter/arsenical resistance protein Acr3 [Lupinus albus]|uniref:Putative Bile acid:sodium symporter/arsenical resistance protein Acr3 n=1 Tax=Lupinus albus TaxID=3870 RepID=A0A6A4NEP0_LUPAL|nr:putative Bile acid:sodium symporter/arsenical resistance protein Acr3 [Lupinus albus]